MSAMRPWQLLAATGLITLFATSCQPRDPGGQETGVEAAGEAPGRREATTTGSEARGQASPKQPQAVVEQLALRFVSPNLGPLAGGNEVTIDGRGFDQYPRIAFGGMAAWIRSVTPTEIRVIVPPPREPVAGSLVVDVTVSNPPTGSLGSVTETLSGAYSYLDAAGTPADGTPADGTSEEQVSERQGGSPAVTGSGTTGSGTTGSGTTGSGTTGSGTTGPGTTDPGTSGTPRRQERASREPTLVASFRFETSIDSADCPAPSISVRFIDRSTGGPTEWWWDFGDGDNSKQQHQRHCYSTSGMRSVTLTVSNGEELASTSKIVTVGME